MGGVDILAFSIRSYYFQKPDILISTSACIAYVRLYSVTVTLVDTDIGSPGIASKTITFKATSPITIPTGTTNGSDVYSVSGLSAPPSKGNYDIKASFAGDALFVRICNEDTEGELTE
jgi:hypothetical protein